MLTMQSSRVVYASKTADSWLRGVDAGRACYVHRLRYREQRQTWPLTDVPAFPFIAATSTHNIKIARVLVFITRQDFAHAHPSAAIEACTSTHGVYTAPLPPYKCNAQSGRPASVFHADEAARANAGANGPQAAPRRVSVDCLSAGTEKNVSYLCY